jgi:hypothetical protein
MLPIVARSPHQPERTGPNAPARTHRPERTGPNAPARTHQPERTSHRDVSVASPVRTFKLAH